MKKGFLTFYILLLVLLIAASDYLLCYVRDSIELYEEKTPDNCMKTIVDNFYNEVNGNSKKYVMASLLHFPDESELGSEYSDPLIIQGDYLAGITGKVFDYKFVKEDYTNGEKEYLLSVDGDPVAKLILEIEDEETRLGFLSIVNMKVKEILPIMKVDSFNYDFKVLSNQEIFINDKKVIDDYLVDVKDINEFKYLYEYVDLPRICNYKVGDIWGLPEIEISNALGQEVGYSEQDGLIDSANWVLLSAESVPDSIVKDIDVLKAAKTWSLFTTKDLSGNNYGLDKVRQYFIEDSYYWKKLGEYARGVDITMVSGHDPANTVISNEHVSDFRQYSDDCFSCRIYFEKTMIIGKGKRQKDVTDSNFYFVNIPGKGWKIADIQSCIKNA